MRIAMLARMLPRRDYAGGVSGQVHLLATALQRKGVDVTVYSLNDAPLGAQYERRPVGDPGAMPTSSSFWLFPWWISRLKLDDYDVVHSHGDDHFLRTATPIVRTFYGTARAEAKYATRLRHRVYHLSMSVPEWISERRATARLAISSATQARLTRPAAVIPCAYDPHVFFPDGRRSANPSILFVGDLGTRKRAELLLSAFERDVRPVLPKAELWLVTTDPVSAPGVRWWGRVETSRLVELYRGAWVFCLPSRYEGFGVPYIEAMACGTPIIATPNGGAEEILARGMERCIVNPDQLGSALADLLEDESRREQIGATAAMFARQYEIDRIADQYIDVYRRIVGDRRH